MTLGIAIILGGWAYAVSAMITNNVTNVGVDKTRRMALFCMCLGIFVDVLLKP